MQKKTGIEPKILIRNKEMHANTFASSKRGAVFLQKKRGAVKTLRNLGLQGKIAGQ